jgi:hypothetical protein
MPIDQELIARRTVKLKLELGQAIHDDRKMVLVAIGKGELEFLPLTPHDRQVDALDSYRAGKLRARRHRRARLTEADPPD